MANLHRFAVTLIVLFTSITGALIVLCGINCEGFFIFCNKIHLGWGIMVLPSEKRWKCKYSEVFQEHAIYMRFIKSFWGGKFAGKSSFSLNPVIFKEFFWTFIHWGWWIWQKIFLGHFCGIGILSVALCPVLQIF